MDDYNFKSGHHHTLPEADLILMSNTTCQLAAKQEQMKNIILRRSRSKSLPPTDFMSYSLLTLVIAITMSSCPTNWEDGVTIQHVFYYGWITAVATGFGVLPFIFFPNPDKYWMGISNAVAGGMMIAASYSLAFEGATFTDELFEVTSFHSYIRTAIGCCVGFFFIVLTKRIMNSHDDLSFGDMQGANAQKMILIILVMTLHSFSEGVGIGVSFGGKAGMQLGQFISLSLAAHNIPEGLAIALVMTSRKVSKLRSGLWAIFTSLPQPIAAIPAFLFVGKFVGFLPAGLGFAAGAMIHVALFDLMVESAEDTMSWFVTCRTATLSCIGMLLLQQAVKISV